MVGSASAARSAANVPSRVAQHTRMRLPPCTACRTAVTRGEGQVRNRLVQKGVYWDDGQRQSWDYKGSRLERPPQSAPADYCLTVT